MVILKAVDYTLQAWSFSTVIIILIIYVYQIGCIDCMTLYQTSTLVSLYVYCVVGLYRLFCLSCLTEVILTNG